MNNQNEQLDPSVVNLVKAIGQSESGGNYEAKGKSGETGAYQFMPDTWKSWAGQYLKDPNAPMTKENQDKVAYSKVKDWGAQGYKPAQIASMWNSGKPDWKGNVGTNSKGVNYNTPDYVQKVGKAYDSYMKGGTPQNIKTSSTVEQPEQIPTTPETPKLFGSKTLGDVGIGAGKSLLGLADTGQQVGDYVARNTVGRLTNAIQGKGFTAPEADNSLANAMGGQDKLTQAETPQNNTQKISKLVGDVVLPAAVTGGAGLLADTLGGAVKGGTALATPTIRGILADNLGKGEKLASLNPIDKLTILKTALKQTNSDTEELFLRKAIGELEPQILAKGGATIAREIQNGSTGLFQGIKKLTELGVGGGLAYKFLAPIWQKYVAGQVSGPNPNNEITVSPAP